MSKTETPTEADEPEQPQLTFEEGRQQTKRYSEQTKVYEAELPEGGVWVFEYKMVDLKGIADKHRTIKKTRRGQEQDIDAKAYELDVFCKGVVDAPEGFPLSPTKLKQQDQVVRDIVGEVADLIADFSEADEETVRKFL